MQPPVLRIMNTPDAEQRKQYAIALDEELAKFERPIPAMDEYDLLLTSAPGGISETCDRKSGSHQCAAILQSGTRAGDWRELPSTRRTGGKREAEPYSLSGSLLAMESEEQDRHAIQNRIRDAELPRMKTLAEFDFGQASRIPSARVRELAEGGYIDRSEPVVFIGECDTGKTHLATALCLAACRQKRRVGSQRRRLS